MPYTTITTEGGLIPADILAAIAQEELTGQRPEDFGLERTRKLSDRISAAWQVARGQWALFQSYLEDLGASETATSETREQWVIPLLRVLGYQLGRNRTAYLVAGRTYALSHRAGDSEDAPPVHIESIRASLDARPPSGRPRLSPHALMQEYLNGTEHLWGMVTNGERLRLLRDSARFTRPAYVEFDLRAMLEGEQFAEFALLYRLLHRSRLPVTSADSPSCLLEQYHQQAIEAGGRVRDGLRDGVEGALKLLGNGLLAHPANTKLRAKLAEGRLTPLDYYRQLLRLVYRLLFLMVAEERNLVAAEEDELDPLSPLAYRPRADMRLSIYRDSYSLSRLRRLAEASGAGRGPFGDLWLGLRTTFRLFEGSDEDAPRRLGLAPLDGDLFSDAACGDLTDDTRLYNADLLAAMRQLSLYREKASSVLRRVNYGALDVEELGSVYESLLDFRPVIEWGTNERIVRLDAERIVRLDAERMPSLDAERMPSLDAERMPSLDAERMPSLDAERMPRFDLVTGTERKTTGSYYTRPELVQELIKSALVPVMDERLKAVGTDPKAREQALLALRVVDPACGSGAFLLAAARRLGRELAKLRAGEEQATPAAFRHAVRDVIRSCIFGVDLNPLATDLCKLALWIEGHCAGMPLSFLDHHIRQGNSLIGASHALVAAGIPDDAYKPVTGDDKATASSFKKRNKQERDLHQKQGMVQHEIFAAEHAAGFDFAAALRALDAQPDTTVAQVRAKARTAAALRLQAATERAKFDLWTAAFFQPLTPANAPFVPTTKHLIDFDPTAPHALLAAPLAEAVGFFHWALEFPQVFTSNESELTNNDPHSFIRTQFDVVLGNPPWEMLQLDPQEFFVGKSQEIVNAANMAARDRLIAKLEQTNPNLFLAYRTQKQITDATQRFVHSSGLFPLTSFGRINLMALFTELCRITIMNSQGRTGLIVPTGIATDSFNQYFFADLVRKQHLVSLYDFENREKIFAEVDSRYKFSLLTIGATNQPTRFFFFATNVTQLADPQRAFTLTPDEIALFNPNTRTTPIFRTRIDAELTKQIYRRIPVLFDEAKGSNPWNISFKLMFMMNTDSHLFQNAPGEGLVPLYEAKLLHQFTHRWATYAGEAARDLSLDELADPTRAITPRYWVPTNAVAERLAGRWARGWLLGFRDIARATDERTAIFSLLPRVGVGNTAPLIFLATANYCQTTCFLAVINSLVFDFIVRQKVGGTHLTFTYINQLPVLPPDRFSAADIAYIVPRVVELVYTAWDMQAFAADVWGDADYELRERIYECWRENITAVEPLAATNPAIAKHLEVAHAYIRSESVVPPFIWDEARRAQARAELDARIAKLYGLTRDELRYILDPADVYGPEFPGETFRVLKEKEQRMYGEYRTRRLVLAAWDRAEG